MARNDEVVSLIDVPVLLTAGSVTFRLTSEARPDGWIARADLAATGERFGIECAGTSEVEALDRLRAWLEWQQEHAAALETLQRAEHSYHRAVVGGAFGASSEGLPVAETSQASLDDVDAARVRLDEVRARKPG